jgi:hypothetical protein
MDTSDLKRRAGITEEYDGSQHPAAIAQNFVNGNQKDAFQAIGGNVGLFAQVALHFAESYGPEQMTYFLQFASRRG